MSEKERDAEESMARELRNYENETKIKLSRQQ